MIGNAYIFYGVVIFVAEMGGALAMIIYGVNLVLLPNDKLEKMVIVDGVPATKVGYHIRVMIPCYSEPFDIVKRTA